MRQARKHLAAALAALFVCALFAAPVRAASKKAAASPAQATQLSPIEVIGSLVKQHDVSSGGSVMVIPHREILERGVTSVSGLLQLLTVTGAAQNSHFNTRGTGRSFVDLRNLGSGRVLVLVNGHRWIPTLFGPVDLSTIPLSLVDRVEVLLDGPSPVYGASGIAGVVNIITVKNFDSAQAGLYYGGYDAHGDGGGFDGKTYDAHALIGTSNDRSSVLMGFGYRNKDPVFAGQRTISRYPLAGFGNLLGSTATPAGHLQLLTNNPGDYAGDCGNGQDGFAFSCNLQGPLVPSGDAHPFTDADRYNDAADSYIDTPQERWYIFSQGHYDLTDNLVFDYLTTYVRRNASELTAPGAFPLGAQGTAVSDGLPIGISASNPFNPFNVDLVPTAPTLADGLPNPVFQQWCARYGAGANGQCSANYDVLQFFGARPLGQGPQFITQNAHNFYFNGGFTGSFPVGGNEWNYHLRYAYGQTLEAEFRQGFTNAKNVQQALGPASGCTGSCVPLNLFGGSSAVTPAMLNYVNTDLHFGSQVTMRNYLGGLDGDFFDGWYAGPWHAQLGYEYLESDGVFRPDPLVSSGIYIGFPIQGSSGRKAFNAQYGQIRVPLAQNLPFAEDLALELGDRFTQLHWSGGEDSAGMPFEGQAHDSSARIGLRWQPSNDLKFRATWAQGYNVPTVSDLFGSQSQSPVPLIDPCVTNQNLPPGQQQNLPNCPQNGRGGAAQPQPTIPVTSGGNPALNPEQGLTRTLSVTYSPSAVPRLSFSADFYKIEVNDAVGTLDPQSLLDGCYLQNQTGFCNAITRQSGAITNVNDLNSNTGSIHTNGFDIAAHYGFHLGRGGTLWLSGGATFTRFLVNCNVVQGANGPKSQCANTAGSVSANGQFGAPKQRINLSADWRLGQWAVVWKTYLIGRMYERCSASRAATLSSPPYSWCSDNADDLNELGTIVYNDLETSYTVDSWNTTFQVGINNILDRSPPIAMTAYVGSYLPVYYRTPGRFVYARATVNF
ncbi:MAG: TonB-dependent receptor domain-containing protein [Gammaproteobacteria bacterium]